MNKVNKENVKIENKTTPVVYVVLRNSVVYNGKQRNDFTTLLRVCETEDNANAYKKWLVENIKVMNTSFYVVPTPFGDIVPETKEQVK